MNSKKDLKEVKNINKTPTNINGWNPDPEGRCSTGELGNEMVYMYDNEIISDDDGFGMLSGKENIPSKLSASYSDIPKSKWNKIFKE